MKAKTRLKKGDLVEVIAGKDKGKQGKILELVLKTGRAVVEGANVVKRHVKPSQKYPQGGILAEPAPIHLSNLKVLSSESAPKGGKEK